MRKLRSYIQIDIAIPKAAFICSVLFIILFAGSFNQTIAQTVQLASYKHHGTYIFDDTVKISETSFFTNFKQQLGLGAKDSMALLHRETDSVGRFVAQYRQYYNGYEVVATTMSLSGQFGVVLRASGLIIPNLNIATNHLLSEQMPVCCFPENTISVLAPR